MIQKPRKTTFLISKWNSTGLNELKCMCNSTVWIWLSIITIKMSNGILLYGFYCLWLCVCTNAHYMMLLCVTAYSKYFVCCMHTRWNETRTKNSWMKKAALHFECEQATEHRQLKQHQQLPAHRHYGTQWNFILPSVIIMNNSSWNYRCETILEKRSWSNKLTHHQQHTTFTRDKIKREMKKQNRTHIHYGITITVSSVCLHTPAWACVHLFIYFKVFNCASIALFHFIL